MNQVIRPNSLTRISALVFCLVCILPVSANQASAARVQSLESIHTAIKSFIRAKHPAKQIEISVGLNSQRLRLAQCQQALRVFWGSHSRKMGNTTVSIRCDAPVKWKIYAPVQVRVFKAVLVAADTLPRGQRLARSDFRLEQRDISALHGGYITQSGAFLGYTVRRQINAGRVISPNALQMPKIVKRGEFVTLIASTNGLQIRTQGVALEDGIKGSTVRVRNKRSQRIVEGRVIESGLIQVNM